MILKVAYFHIMHGLWIFLIAGKGNIFNVIIIQFIEIKEKSSIDAKMLK